MAARQDVRGSSSETVQKIDPKIKAEAMQRLSSIAHVEWSMNKRKHPINVYVRHLEDTIRDLQPNALGRTWRENQQLKSMTKDLIEISNRGDFSNGVTGPNGEDEGDYKTGQIIDEIIEKLRKIESGAL